jgi:hypothetical protein
MAYKNIEDARAAGRLHYSRNKQKYYLRNQQAKEKLYLKINAIRGSTPCADCGVKYPYYVMDFDHIPGFKKVGNISDLVKKGATKLLVEEIKKCELVCANCHRTRTHLRRG